MEGERKSIEPLSNRVGLPTALGAVADPEQALQQFVNQSSWDEAAVARAYLNFRNIEAISLGKPKIFKFFGLQRGFLSKIFRNYY